MSRFSLIGRLAAASLGLVAGFVDAYGFLRWHAFGANMTGNTVVFAISLFRNPAAALLPLTLIVAFLAGSILGRAIVDRSSGTVGLVVEAMVLAASAFASGYALAVIALAMGLQNATITMFSGVAANTSFVTGDYSRFGQALADFINVPARREGMRQTLAVLGPLLGAYTLGALIAAFSSALPYGVVLPVPIVLGIAYAAHRKALT